jgi:ribosomal protein L40E
MRVILYDVMQHPEWYKLCRRCNSLNHIENNECWHCYSEEFNYNIEHYIESEKQYQAWMFGLGPKEIEIKTGG